MKKHYYLYIDDSGWRDPNKKLKERNDGMDHFALGGILVDSLDKDFIKSKHDEFCTKWNITYPLHSTEIRGRRNNFAWLENKSSRNDKFHEELEEFLLSVPVIGFAAVVHRPGYNKRYEQKYGEGRWLICKTAYTILIERVTKYVMEQGGTFEVFFEYSGKKENALIQQYAKSLKEDGHPFSKETSDKYKVLQPEDYRNIVLGEPRRKEKSNRLTQIADLYLYPMVKRKYDETFSPWNVLFENKKVIDSLLDEEEIDLLGIKYSCFEDVKSKKPE